MRLQGRGLLFQRSRDSAEVPPIATAPETDILRPSELGACETANMGIGATDRAVLSEFLHLPLHPGVQLEQRAPSYSSCSDQGRDTGSTGRALHTESLHVHVRTYGTVHAICIPNSI